MFIRLKKSIIGACLFFVSHAFSMTESELPDADSDPVKVAAYCTQIKKAFTTIFPEKKIYKKMRCIYDLQELVDKFVADERNRDRIYNKIILYSFHNNIEDDIYDYVRLKTPKKKNKQSDTISRKKIFFNINLGLLLSSQYPFDNFGSMSYLMAGCVLLLIFQRKFMTLSLSPKWAEEIINEVWNHGGEKFTDLTMNGRSLRYLLRKQYEELKSSNKVLIQPLQPIIDKLKAHFPDEYDAWEDLGW